ncbi:MAG: RsmB/NOP family class I SAM-dependent RNA methyltransferase, partial [Bauldia sp.]|nr:RsmB/NOP family class I SAM-dependent RNA methyltransferase [Bauldia sp.]
DALRWRASSAWVMDDETPRAVVLATIGKRWGFGADGLAAMIDGVPHAPPPLSEAEKERIDDADLGAAPDHVRGDIPEWLAPHFARSLGEGWVGEAEALALRPPLDMRVNRLKADRDKVLKSLANFHAAETAISPDGLRIAATEGDGRHPNVQVEPGFQRGLFEIQDEGSQIAALMVGARPGEQVLDLCAGAGGKTLALAAGMMNRGQIQATDSDRARLAPIFDRLKRAGTRNVQVRPAGVPLDDLEGRMDAVLIDAPCTGVGTWRRRPDAKWRLSERNLDDRTREQSALLSSSVRFLKPGGRLVYVTCSLLAEENDDRIAALLAEGAGVSLVAPATAVERALEPEVGTRLLAACRQTAHGVMLTPGKTGTDGFFVSVLERTG